MTTHLVVTAEEESFVVVARHISDLLDEGQGRTKLADTAGSSFYSKCEEIIAEKKFDTLLDRFIDEFEVLFAKASDNDLEACLNVCVHLLPYLEEYAPEGIQKLSQAVRAQVDNHAERRLATLVQIFNVADDPVSQYKILLDAIAFAKASSQSTLLAPAIRSQIDSWVDEWELSTAEKQRLYLAAADLFRANKKRKALIKEAAKLTNRALSLVGDAPAHELKDLKQLAATAVADFIRSPDVFQFDLLHLPVVRQLESDPEDGPLFQLLQIVLDGDVKALKSFLAASPPVMEAAGLVAQDVEAKTRLMALLVLADSDRTVSFSAIQEQLDLQSTGEVEEWLVRAMGKKLVDGQMDQVLQQVVITKAGCRAFGPQHWQTLQEQLAAWKVSLDGMSGLVEQNGVPAPKPAPRALQA